MCFFKHHIYMLVQTQAPDFHDAVTKFCHSVFKDSISHISL